MLSLQVQLRALRGAAEHAEEEAAEGEVAALMADMLLEQAVSEHTARNALEVQVASLREEVTALAAAAAREHAHAEEAEEEGAEAAAAADTLLAEAAQEHAAHEELLAKVRSRHGPVPPSEKHTVDREREFTSRSFRMDP